MALACTFLLYTAGYAFCFIPRKKNLRLHRLQYCRLKNKFISAIEIIKNLFISQTKSKIPNIT